LCRRNEGPRRKEELMPRSVPKPDVDGRVNRIGKRQFW